MTDTIQRIIELALQIQQIPAPTFHESRRAEFVRGLFEQEGLKQVSVDEVGNVYGLLSRVAQSTHPTGSHAKSDARPLVVSAHLDTVFPIEMDVSVRRENSLVHGIGIGDNSMGVAALLGLVWLIRERQINLKGDLWLVANVCEEGLGDLRGMKAVVERYGENVLAYLVLEGMALGHVYHRAVGVKRYRITARTKCGHSWSDYGQLSAIHELSKLVVQLTSLELPKEPRTTMNVGKISGGTSVNVIAPEAWLELEQGDVDQAHRALGGAANCFSELCQAGEHTSQLLARLSRLRWPGTEALDLIEEWRRAIDDHERRDQD